MPVPTTAVHHPAAITSPRTTSTSVHIQASDQSNSVGRHPEDSITLENYLRHVGLQHSVWHATPSSSRQYQRFKDIGNRQPSGPRDPPHPSVARQQLWLVFETGGSREDLLLGDVQITPRSLLQHSITPPSTRFQDRLQSGPSGRSRISQHAVRSDSMGEQEDGQCQTYPGCRWLHDLHGWY